MSDEGLDRLTDSYQKGYQKGLTWDKPWIPDGPWVNTDKPESIKSHEEWKRGFSDGKKEQENTHD